MRKGVSKYPITKICEKCGNEYIITRNRYSKVCYECALHIPKEYVEKKGKYFENWIAGLKRFIEEVKK